jgi:hypothetical protein
MVKCGDENATFSGLFVKTLHHRFPDFDARGFLRSNCSFFSRKTHEMKIGFCRRGKDREVSAKIPEDFAVQGRRTFPSTAECAVHSPTVPVWRSGQETVGSGWCAVGFELPTEYSRAIYDEQGTKTIDERRPNRDDWGFAARM